MGWKRVVKRYIPKRWINLRHFFYAWIGAKKYEYPSENLLVIGVTGTSGKSSTIYFLRQVLEYAGYRVGSMSTIEFCVAGECTLNNRKMTMLGKMEIQKYVRKMVDAGCQIALIETTSEGRLQHRHRWINYDTMVLTNLYPEHIESHGSFNAYKQAKLDLFDYVSRCRKKQGRGKTFVVNGDSPHANEFFSFPAEQKILFGTQSACPFAAESVQADTYGLRFKVGEHVFHPPLFGAYNVLNITAVIAVARSLGLDWPVIQKAVNGLRPAPGRIERIPEAEMRGFRVIVDYAFEPVAMAALYEVVKLFQPKKIIHVFGSTGGGRDVARRFTVGAFVGQRADVCIVTNEDPYDDDPQKIIDDVAGALIKAGKKEGKDLFTVMDRRQAIVTALEKAEEGDVVLVTGKGSEQAMVVQGQLIPWDDRLVVRESLASLGTNNV